MKKLALIAALLFAPASFAQIVVTSTAGGGVSLGTPGPTGPAGANGAPGPNCALTSPPGHCDLGTAELDAGSIVAPTITTNPLPSGFNLLTAFGDSTVAGVGDTLAGGFVTHLATLAGLIPNNEGVGGTTSTQIISRMGYGTPRLTVAGGVIPATSGGNPTCQFTGTWNAGYEATNNVNTAGAGNVPNAPAPYNNGNGAGTGGIWGVLQGVNVQGVEGFWNGSAWVNDGIYYFVPADASGNLACPPSPVTIPPNSAWTPKLFNWMSGVQMYEGGYNNIQGTGGVAQVEADYTSVCIASNWTGLVLPVWYGLQFAAGSTGANNVAAANTYAQANCSSGWMLDSNGNNLLQYMGSLYNPADPIDVYYHTANPLAVPASLHSTALAAGTLTSNITDTTSCSFTLSDSTAYGYITIGSEKIRIDSQSGTTVSACGRGFGGTTAATHTSGTSFDGVSVVHLNDAGYTDIANWIYSTDAFKSRISRVVTASSLLQALTNPPAPIATTTAANTFTANQTLDAKGTATSLQNYGSNDLIFNCSYWDGTKTVTQGCGYIYEQMFAGTAPSTSVIITPQHLTGTFAVEVDGNFVTANGAAATSGASQPGPTVALAGHCWTGSSSAVSSATLTPIVSGGISGLNIVTADGCGNTPVLQFNGVAIGPGSAVNLNQTTPQYVQEHSNTVANADWVSFQAPVSGGNAGLTFYNTGGVSGTWNVRSLETSGSNQLTFNACDQQTTTVGACANPRNLITWKNGSNSSASIIYDYSSFTAANTLTLQNASGTVGFTIATPTGTPTYTAGTNVTSCAQASTYTNKNARGTVTIVGGTATTGTICTVNFSATLSAAPGLCQVTQNGGATFYGIGDSKPTTAGFAITSGVTVSGATITVDYNCVP